jgi:hypothetical protein
MDVWIVVVCADGPALNSVLIILYYIFFIKALQFSVEQDFHMSLYWTFHFYSSHMKGRDKYQGKCVNISDYFVQKLVWGLHDHLGLVCKIHQSEMPDIYFCSCICKKVIMTCISWLLCCITVFNEDVLSWHTRYIPQWRAWTAVFTFWTYQHI